MCTTVLLAGLPVFFVRLSADFLKRSHLPVDLGGCFDVRLILLHEIAEQFGLIAQGHVHIVKNLLDVGRSVLAGLLIHGWDVVAGVLRLMARVHRLLHGLHMLVTADDVHVVAAEAVLV